MVLRYSLGRLEAPMCLLNDDDIDIDINATEPALRVLALSRTATCLQVQTPVANAPPLSTA